MKALVLSALAIAATLSMSSCSSENDPVDEATKEAPVEIKLNAGVIQTKAAIDVDQEQHPTQDVSNVYFYRQDVEAPGTPSWTAPSASFTGTIKTTGAIEDFTQYYATNGYNTHITGLYLGTESSTVPNVTDGKVEFSIDGTQDVLWAKSVDVGNRNVEGTTALNFKHKLTKFKFVANTSNGIGAVTGISITIKNAKASSTINLADGNLGAWTPDASADFTVNGLTAAADGGESSASEGVMLQPNLASLSIAVSAPNYLSEAQNLTITGSDEGSFKEGSSYTITITFSGKAVTATATIANWTDGTNPGAGVIE